MYTVNHKNVFNMVMLISYQICQKITDHEDIQGNKINTLKLK